MNSKTVRILKQLCDGQTYRVNDLARELDLSARMIRYEIEQANSFLTREGFCKIESGRRGISLSVPAAEKDHLRNWLAELSANDISLTAGERRLVILILLLSSREFLTVQYIADLLGVSKSCIDKDFALLKKRITEEGLTLHCKPGSGNRILGDERRIRETSLKIVEHNLHFGDYLSKEAYHPDYVERQVQRYFCDAWFPNLVAIIHEVEEESEKRLSYNSFRNLLLNLCVALTRISLDHVLSEKKENLVLLQATKEFQIVEAVSKHIQTLFSISLPLSEKCALTVLLVGAKYTTSEPYLKEDWAEIQILTDRMIRAMSKKLAIPFYEDEEIYTALQAHLGPMVFRLKNKVPTVNPNLEQVKRNYENIYSALTGVIKSIDSPLLKGIHEDDIAFLSLHFCASVVRRKRALTVSRVAIVCIHGIGTANLLKELICSRFKSVRVTAITTSNHLGSIDLDEIDFIISSIPLSNCSAPWIQVNPILTEDDLDRIEKMIEKHSIRSSPSDDFLELFNDVVSTVEQQSVIDNMPLLIDSLEKCFGRAGITIKQNKAQPSLAQLLPAEKIKCRQTAADWESAVRLAGSILLDSGDVTQDFIESMIETVNNAGPYSVISKGVALVHSDVGRGVNYLSMSMITLKEPVCFHHPTNDPVKLILCLASIDNSSHVLALEDFIHFLRSNDLEEICKEDDPQKFNKYLHRSKLLI